MLHDCSCYFTFCFRSCFIQIRVRSSEHITLFVSVCLVVQQAGVEMQMIMTACAWPSPHWISCQWIPEESANLICGLGKQWVSSHNPFYSVANGRWRLNSSLSTRIDPTITFFFRACAIPPRSVTIQPTVWDVVVARPRCEISFYTPLILHPDR